MDAIGTILIMMAVATVPSQGGRVEPVRNVQRVEASVTIIAAEQIDVRAQLKRGSSEATTRQYRERDKVPLVEFF